MYVYIHNKRNVYGKVKITTSNLKCWEYIHMVRLLYLIFIFSLPKREHSYAFKKNPTIIQCRWLLKEFIINDHINFI
jgi:hypothetical protein